ncbi:hypothetical protein E2C01_089466 [Portunus trituberculatus]|uniref:Uncharacterized protein n=1 Tax=Portunus trituberculatus TaxID=210409 RepID=A0A5B7JDM2_PORTR|nr:hypothetical protein [Portunus trituberculatus]
MNKYECVCQRLSLLSSPSPPPCEALRQQLHVKLVEITTKKKKTTEYLACHSQYAAFSRTLLPAQACYYLALNFDESFLPFKSPLPCILSVLFSGEAAAVFSEAKRRYC